MVGLSSAEVVANNGTQEEDRTVQVQVSTVIASGFQPLPCGESKTKLKSAHQLSLLPKLVSVFCHRTITNTPKHI